MIAIDTGIWIEYINTNGNLHSRAKAVIDSVNSGKANAILTPVNPIRIGLLTQRIIIIPTHNIIVSREENGTA